MTGDSARTEVRSGTGVRADGSAGKTTSLGGGCDTAEQRASAAGGGRSALAGDGAAATNGGAETGAGSQGGRIGPGSASNDGSEGTAGTGKDVGSREGANAADARSTTALGSGPRTGAATEGSAAQSGAGTTTDAATSAAGGAADAARSGTGRSATDGANGSTARGGTGVPRGSVGVPIRLADPAALALIRPGDRVDLLRIEDTDRTTAVAGAVLVLRVTGADDPTAGALLLALNPQQARRAVSTPRLGFAVVIRPD